MPLELCELRGDLCAQNVPTVNQPQNVAERQGRVRGDGGRSSEYLEGMAFSSLRLELNLRTLRSSPQHRAFYQPTKRQRTDRPIG